MCDAKTSKDFIFKHQETLAYTLLLTSIILLNFIVLYIFSHYQLNADTVIAFHYDSVRLFLVDFRFIHFVYI